MKKQSWKTRYDETALVPAFVVKVNDSVETPICLVPANKNTSAFKNREKMATLIAAAPELRDALIDMLENGDARSRQMARAALRKAGVTGVRGERDGDEIVFYKEGF